MPPDFRGRIKVNANAMSVRARNSVSINSSVAAIQNSSSALNL
jgi:hypothetical protein